VLLRTAITLALVATTVPAAAFEPLRAGGAQLVLGGEVQGTLAPQDDGWFNDADYGREYSRNVLRLFRLTLAARLSLGAHVAVLGELRSDNLDAPEPYALYLRLRPWRDRSFDVQAGRIPPVFGAFARRRYGKDNPLVGLPLGYQYLTTVRADAAPATSDDLLRARGNGWRTYYPLGYPRAAPGLPLASVLRWDTGVQVRVGSQPVALSAALTQGTLSNPRFRDDNDGKQFAARVAFQPLVGLVLGLSGARGEYVADALRPELSEPARDRTHLQQAWGFDVEYSRGYWLLRAEGIWSRWDTTLDSLRDDRLRAMALMLEVQYRLAPGLYVAARGDHLGFNVVSGSSGPFTWDAPVDRIEAGLGYSPHRHVLFKLSYQHNWRDGGRVRSEGFVAAQALVWF